MRSGVPRPSDPHAPYPSGWAVPARVARQVEWKGLRALGMGRAAWTEWSTAGPLAAVREEAREPVAAAAIAAGDRLAFLVTYGSAEPRWSIENFVAGVAAAGYVPHIVYNGDPASTVVRELERIAPVVTRVNQGHDFGAYRAVILALARSGRLSSVDRLILGNDSVYYPDRFGELAGRVDTLPADLAGITWNWNPRPHVQSYFLRFAREALTAPSMRDFWVGYRPTSVRSRVIRTGEVGLSVALIRNGRSVRAVAGPAELGRMLRGAAVDDVLGEARLVPRKFRSVLTEDDEGGEPHLLAPDVGPPLNPSHAWGIVLNRVMGAPVKKDIWKSAAVSEVIPYLSGYTDTQLDGIAADLESKLTRFRSATLAQLADFVVGNA